jgi:hypothetical protein
MKLNFQQIYFWRKRERLHLFSFAHEEIEKDHTYLSLLDTRIQAYREMK